MVQTLADGIAQGSLYAMVASGLVFIFGIVGVPNFAHGESVMLGGMVTAVLVVQYDIPVVFAGLVGAAAGTIFGLILARGLYWPLRRYPEVSVMAASFAVLAVTEAIANQVWGALPRTTPTSLTGSVPIAGAQVPYSWLVIIGAALLFIGVVHLFVHHSRTGKAMRAMALNNTAARLVGIPVRRYSTLAFGIGSALAGVAGVFYSLAFGVSPTMGSGVALNAFIVIIFAGAGSVFGAYWVGLLLGLVEAFGGTYISSGYETTFGFVLLVIILVLRPEGLFRRGIVKE